MGKGAQLGVLYREVTRGKGHNFIERCPLFGMSFSGFHSIYQLYFYLSCIVNSSHFFYHEATSSPPPDDVCWTQGHCVWIHHSGQHNSRHLLLPWLPRSGVPRPPPIAHLTVDCWLCIPLLWNWILCPCCSNCSRSINDSWFVYFYTYVPTKNAKLLTPSFWGQWNLGAIE